MASPCDDILKQGVFKTLNYQVGDISQESLRTWFFSDDFESRYRNNNTSASITIPLEGIPVTFGGSHASQDAWEKRTIQENASKWDLSKLSWQKVLQQEEATEVIRAWTTCIQAHIASQDRQPNRLLLQTQELSDVVTLSVRYQHVPGAPVPVIFDFQTSGGLNATQALASLTFTELAEGQDFQFPWVGNADIAVITVRSSIGDKSITARRPANGRALVAYFVPEGEAWDYSEDRRSETITTDDRHNEEADDQQPTSPDGKWWASDKAVELSVGPKEKIGNAFPLHVGGPGTHHFTTLDYSNERRTVRLFLRAWTHPVSYLIVAPILSLRVPMVPKTATFEVRNGRLQIDVPKDYKDAKLQVVVGSATFDASLGQQTDSLLLVNDPHLVGANIRFEYQVRLPRLPASNLNLLNTLMSQGGRNKSLKRDEAFHLEGASLITFE
jgi:hypothetical protein